VEVVVGQSLGDVALGDAGARLELAQVEDELVRAQPGLARVEHLVVVRVRVRLRVRVRVRVRVGVGVRVGVRVRVS